ncbi:hypothetical protein [Rhodococcus sp. NPDC058521]|uniref:hypothetical protein n=1 Tax=Rhodococcus sp. NPDC058521 TaxID=3346536 RepID=UPI003668FFB5
MPDRIVEMAGDKDAFDIRSEQLDVLDVEVLVWIVGGNPGAAERIAADPLYRLLAVARDGRDVFVTDPVVSGALTWGTVLSLPHAVESLVPLLSVAADRSARARDPSLCRFRRGPDEGQFSAE